MKSSTKTPLALLASMAFAFSASAAVNVVVEWDDHDDYSDLEYVGSEASFEGFSKSMTGYIRKMASRYLPDGTELRLRFHNVDLAGEIEPWLAPPFDDVRIVRSIYPPRLEFSYELIGADGEPLLKGRKALSNPTFQEENQPARRFFDDDQYFYEKELIGSWIRNELSRDAKRM